MVQRADDPAGEVQIVAVCVLTWVNPKQGRRRRP